MMADLLCFLVVVAFLMAAAFIGMLLAVLIHGDRK